MPVAAALRQRTDDCSLSHMERDVLRGSCGRANSASLHDILLPFQTHKINLTKIESRPSKKKAWNYYFFVDFEGHSEEPRVQKTLEILEKGCTFLRILGSYPKADV